jgi:hypothetical protein
VNPYVLIGTVDKQIEDLRARRERWGISYYVIFEPYVDALRRSLVPTISKPWISSGLNCVQRLANSSAAWRG